jgi:hypothetical protein
VFTAALSMGNREGRGEAVSGAEYSTRSMEVPRRRRHREGEQFVGCRSRQRRTCPKGQVVRGEVQTGWPGAVTADLIADHVTLGDEEIRESR